jgi:predicted RNase H-like nuclease (RuvC/YqgF family)
MVSGLYRILLQVHNERLQTDSQQLERLSDALSARARRTQKLNNQLRDRGERIQTLERQLRDRDRDLQELKRKQQRLVRQQRLESTQTSQAWRLVQVLRSIKARALSIRQRSRSGST